MARERGLAPRFQASKARVLLLDDSRSFKKHESEKVLISAAEFERVLDQETKR